MLGQNLIEPKNTTILHFRCNQYQNEKFSHYVNITLDFFNQLSVTNFDSKQTGEYKKKFFLKLFESRDDETLSIFLDSLQKVRLSNNCKLYLTPESLAKSLCDGELNPTLSEFFSLSYFCKKHIKTLFLQKIFTDKRVLKKIGNQFIEKVNAMEFPIESINFQNTKSFTSSALDNIKEIQEIVLSTLNGAFKNEDIVKFLKRSKKLQKIDLSYCHNISDEVLFALAENNKDVTSLSLRESSLFSAKAIASLVKECKNLQKLDLSDCGIDDEKAFVLAENAKNLRTLDISYSSVTEKSVEALLTNCKHIQKIKVKRCKALSCEFLQKNALLTF